MQNLGKPNEAVRGKILNMTLYTVNRKCNSKCFVHLLIIIWQGKPIFYEEQQKWTKKIKIIKVTYFYFIMGITPI